MECLTIYNSIIFFVAGNILVPSSDAESISLTASLSTTAETANVNNTSTVPDASNTIDNSTETVVNSPDIDKSTGTCGETNQKQFPQFHFILYEAGLFLVFLCMALTTGAFIIKRHLAGDTTPITEIEPQTYSCLPVRESVGKAYSPYDTLAIVRFDSTTAQRERPRTRNPYNHLKLEELDVYPKEHEEITNEEASLTESMITSI